MTDNTIAKRKRTHTKNKKNSGDLGCSGRVGIPFLLSGTSFPSEHLISPPIFSGVRVAPSLVFLTRMSV